MNNQNFQKTARKMAKAKVEFRIHLINYIVVNTLLAIINLTLTPGYIWFKWPLLGWGIGIIFHALSVYFLGASSNKERMIEVEMRKVNDETFKKRR
jgi:hypothetical protein